MDPTSNPFELLSDEGQKKLVKAQQPAKKEDKKPAPAGKATTTASAAAPSALASKPKGTPEAPVKQGPKNPIAVPTFDDAPRTQRGGRGGGRGGGGRGGRARGGHGAPRAVQSGRKREFDHHVSGTGRPIGEVKREGRGKANWGAKTEEGIDAQTVADDVTHNTEHKDETVVDDAATQGDQAPQPEEEPDNSVVYADFEAEQRKKAEELKKLLGGNREVRKPEANPDFGKKFHKLETEEDEESEEEEGGSKKAKKAAQKKGGAQEVSAELLGFTSPPVDRDRRGGRGGRGGRGSRGGRGARGDRGDRGNTRGVQRDNTAPRRGGAFDATEGSNKYDSLFPSLSGK